MSKIRSLEKTRPNYFAPKSDKIYSVYPSGYGVSGKLSLKPNEIPARDQALVRGLFDQLNLNKKKQGVRS